MSETSVALPVAEREAKFRTAFAKKLQAMTSGPSTSDDLAFRLPEHTRLNDDIAAKDVSALTSATKGSGTEPALMLFKSDTGPILLTTRAMFFIAVGSDSSSRIPWADLDIMANYDLVNDDTTLRPDRDETLLDPSVPVMGQVKLALGIWCLPTLLCMAACSQASSVGDKLHDMGLALLCLTGFVWAVPLIAFIAARLRRTALHRRFRENSNFYNVIAVGSQRHPRRIHYGTTGDCPNIITCIKLALQIFRLQQEKYGPLKS